MYLLSWRKTNFLCIILILSPKSISKLINVNCLHFIGCQNYNNVLFNRVLYQIQVTALLPFFLSILHLLLQLSKLMLWRTGKLLLAIVMSTIFGPFREKGRDMTRSYDKSPHTDRKIQKATWQHKNATKLFNYTMIADRLRAVSWGNDSYPTGVVKPVNGIPTLKTLPKSSKSCDCVTFRFLKYLLFPMKNHFTSLRKT